MSSRLERPYEARGGASQAPRGGRATAEEQKRQQKGITVLDDSG